MTNISQVPQKAEPILTGRTLHLSHADNGPERLINVAKALGSSQRLRILDCLNHRAANVSEIAELLEMPLATVNLHLNKLEGAGLIQTKMIAARRGQQRMCARVADIVVLHLPQSSAEHDSEIVVQSMPVGAFVGHNVAPTCGIVSSNGMIGRMDDPISFYEPRRYEAQLVWFAQGFVEYEFPYRATDGRRPSHLQLSLELCSEAIPHHLDWPSDIFMEINGVEVGIWTSPADFGGEPGRFTPAWWKVHNTQYGLLKTWRVDKEGTSIDGRPLSDVTINDLALGQSQAVEIRIGVHADAVHMGGINIFGSEFGNHAQDIVLELFY